MKVFDNYEISPCKRFEEPDSSGKFYFEVCEPAEADVWTLYGHINGEGAQAIGDFATREHAEEVYSCITGQPFPASYQSRDWLRVMHAGQKLLEALKAALEWIDAQLFQQRTEIQERISTGVSLKRPGGQHERRSQPFSGPRGATSTTRTQSEIPEPTAPSNPARTSPPPKSSMPTATRSSTRMRTPRRSFRKRTPALGQPLHDCWQHSSPVPTCSPTTMNRTVRKGKPSAKRKPPSRKPPGGQHENLPRQSHHSRS